ncbi:MAG TPA: homoserine dehydrogenase [Acidobacteriota bacterium]|nr:homoserine dehydrogenase [Acidobacteriota bacterium]
MPQQRIGLAGFGTVGQALARQLTEEAQRYRRELGLDLKLACVFDRSFHKKERSFVPAEVEFTADLEDFQDKGPDIVVELLGGEHPADELIRGSLERGRSVVTANKLLMARHGPDYLRLATMRGAFLGFEAAVGGGIPVLRTLRRSLFSDQVVRLRGILNATCNFILSEMASSGADYHQAVSRAQRLGYAEADPSLDVSGRDAADKLGILSALCFGVWPPPDSIPVQGIEALDAVDFRYARKLGYALRPLASASLQDGEGPPRLRVSPFMVSRDLPLSKIEGEVNAVEIEGRRLGSTVLSGPGAGGSATAVSAASDVLNAALWRQGQGAFYAAPYLVAQDIQAADASAEAYPFYLRFFVRDRTGILAALAGILHRHGINIHSVVQEAWDDPADLPFVITVEPTSFSSLEAAVADMAQLDFHTRPPLALPILESR